MKLLKNPLTYIAIVLILIVSFYGYKSITGNSIGEYDEFAKYLKEQGAVMYGTEWCGFCNKQKELFGNSFKEINFVDCDKNQQACSEAGVTGYPTWKINNQNYPGLQSLERLAELTNYTGELK